MSDKEKLAYIDGLAKAAEKVNSNSWEYDARALAQILRLIREVK